MRCILAVVALAMPVTSGAKAPAIARPAAVSRAVRAEKTRWGALFDLRPSWIPKTGQLYGFYSADLSYRLTPTNIVGYQQQVFQDLRNAGTLTNGSAVRVFDGYFYAQWNELPLSSVYRVTFDFEPRLYLPTDPMKRGPGFLTQARAYFKVRSRVGEQLTFLFMEVPILHLYSRAGSGSGSPNDPAFANPVFENRVYFAVIATSPDKRWSIYFPVILGSTRYASYAAGATLNDSWDHQIWIYPELLFQATDELSVGVGYESRSFINSGGMILNALGLGSLQGIVRLSF